MDVVATEALHDGRRTPLGRRHGAVGYLVEGGSRIFFAGDTDLFDGMRDLSHGLDAALLPVWGWGPRVGPGHLDPERAARAVALRQPRLAVPIHWGTFAGPRVWWRADPALPAREFERLVAVHAPQVSVRILAPGEDTPLDVPRLAWDVHPPSGHRRASLRPRPASGRACACRNSRPAAGASRSRSS